jgi:hypothetical protein
LLPLAMRMAGPARSRLPCRHPQELRLHPSLDCASRV